MSQHQRVPDNEGLQVDTHVDQAAKAPEVIPYSQTSHYYNPTVNHAPTTKEQKPPFGLGLWTFAGLVALLTAIIVGAGVGGGLGAALANKSSDCSVDDSLASAPSATSEPTSCPTNDNRTSGNDTSDDDTSDYAPKPPVEVNKLQLPCPGNKQKETRFASRDGKTRFKWWCGVDAPYGNAAKEGGRITDIAILAYSIDDCMQACANIYQRDQAGVACKSIVFSKTMFSSYTSRNANCYLKNGTKTVSSSWGFDSSDYAYAELDDDD
ncbi:hypothetical protein FAUST_3065 [Fusarium austroamericanum]|uniref:Apple domain-containing protein n=1 Tax=Fusarium austroamericanum TaxID=282268 RepID=A0AAN6C5Q5_FUSAU|nr:hypothetical protein FAUST_3065 [Fusarium austroamericanum]